MNPNPAQLLIESRLAVRQLKAKNDLSTNHPHASIFFQSQGLDLGKIRQHSSKMLTAGTLAGALLISPPETLMLTSQLANNNPRVLQTDLPIVRDSKSVLSDQLKELLPQPPRPLLIDEEKTLSLLIEKLTRIKVRSNLEGEHLNTSYGLIGAEQHLPRFPGDSVAQHDTFQESGITPGLGAWGYFAASKAKLKTDDILREKYYVAVQTLYLPDWEKRFLHLRDWYKYRKVLVINPENGQGVIAVVADSGPAAWTGKQFGGSPEVMYYLGLHTGSRKGAIVLLFVDDPDNKVPLGPVQYTKIELSNHVGQRVII